MVRARNVVEEDWATRCGLSSDLMEPHEGVVLAGRFALERRLGRGGMGDVWAATNTVTGRKVAIKLLHGEDAADPTVRKRFLREARAASRVQHPNVVEILDVLELDDGAPAMVMERLEGESLGQRLRRERTLSLSDTASLLLPAITAVGAAHAAGVVHRDLKPDNIFISKGHEGVTVVKVLDFGIAKIAGEGEGGVTAGLTGTGAMLGTPYYMAPEQLFTDETIDYRCDIWSLGIILYECLAGRRPARGDNFADIVKVIATRAITPLEKVAPDVPDEIIALVSRMLAFEKEGRPKSLREVCDVLRHHTDVLATSFGDPVLKPIRQGADPDGSGGLRKADVDLFLAEDAIATERAIGAPTIEVRNAVVDTQGRLGLGITLSDRGAKKNEAAAARPKAKWPLPVAALSALAIVALGAQMIGRSRASGAETTSAPPAAVSLIPSAAPAPATSEPEKPAAQPDTPSPIASEKPKPQPTARPRAGAATPKAETAKPAATETTAQGAPAPTTAPGGLVEKPPF